MLVSSIQKSDCADSSIFVSTLIPDKMKLSSYVWCWMMIMVIFIGTEYKNAILFGMRAIEVWFSGFVNFISHHFNLLLYSSGKNT